MAMNDNICYACQYENQHCQGAPHYTTIGPGPARTPTCQCPNCDESEPTMNEPRIQSAPHPADGQPSGRTYTCDELNAAIRFGFARIEGDWPTGMIYWGTGPQHLLDAKKKLRQLKHDTRKLQLLVAAMEREWDKEGDTAPNN